MAENQEQAAAQAHLTDHQIKVLLIDDQAMVGEAVRRMLEGEADIDFHFEKDPSKAVQRAKDLSPTVILQDLVMPEIDGLTLVKYFRASPQTRDIPLIVLSTKEEAVTKAEAFARGANDYLVKLPDRIELLARIRYHSKGYINLLQRNDLMAKLQAELDEAAEYVKKLLPAPVDDGPVRTDWRFVASTSLGGDALGYYWLDDDHFVMYVLDVTGHGVGAALLSVSVLNVIRSQSLPGVDFHEPDQVLKALNEGFPSEDHNGNMFSLWYGVFNPKTRELVYASGGHPPALLLTGDSGEKAELTPLRTKGAMIGGFPGAPFEKAVQPVNGPGRLYVYSDGAYEIHKTDGQMWTLSEFKDFMRQPADPDENVMDRLLAHVKKLSGSDDLEDDLSMLEAAFD